MSSIMNKLRTLKSFVWPAYVLRQSLRSLHSKENIPISYNLHEKIAIVTASTDGIGLSIAKRLALSGASVVISSRMKDNVDRALNELNKLKITGKISGIVCDCSKKDDQKNLIEHTVGTFGGLDILILNAGISSKKPAALLDQNEEDWDYVMNVNLKAPFLLTKEALPYLKQREKGSIVYISSITAYHPLLMFPSTGLYSISKTALLGLTKTVAAQVASFGIRANVVSPGMIHTNLTSRIAVEHQQIYNKMVPLGRFGECDEVSGLVAFLCSDDASYITGESLVPAGGIYSRL